MSDYPRITSASEWLWRKSPVMWRVTVATVFALTLVPIFVADVIYSAVKAVPDWWDRFRYLSSWGRESMANAWALLVEGPGFGEGQ